MTTIKFCAIIPTYDNPATVGGVAERVQRFIPHLIVVDDGSGPQARGIIDKLGEADQVEVVRRKVNGGKGAAVKDGLRRAEAMGFTHALQVDADGQHCIDDIPLLLEEAVTAPDALILASPIFDESAPRMRLWARRLTQFWTRIEAGGPVIDDPMCGFRVYPVKNALAACAIGNRMDFDPEVAVRMVWRGAPVVNVPTRVKYLPAEAGGVSRFRPFLDNLLISWMHIRLVVLSLFRLDARRLRRLPP